MSYPMPASDRRALQVLEAAARTFNDELTILRNAQLLAEPGAALEMKASLDRCVWAARTMLAFARRKGARPGHSALWKVADEAYT